MATLAGKPMTQNELGLADVYLILLLSFNSKNVDKYKTHKSGGANTRDVSFKIMKIAPEGGCEYPERGRL